MERAKWVVFLTVMGIFIRLSFISNAWSKTDVPYSIDKDTVTLWHFDENKGEVAKDKSKNRNNGQIVGATWCEGRFGSALKFDGKSYVDCGDDDSLNPESALTVETWIRLTNTDFEGKSWVTIVNNESYMAGYHIQFYLGHLACSIGTSDGAFTVQIGDSDYLKQIYDTRWHHVAMTYDGKLLSLYYDGNLMGSTAATGEIKPSTYSLWIGGMNWAKSRFFEGEIDEVRISNIARKIAGESLADILKTDTVAIKVQAKNSCYLKEEKEKIILGNKKMEFAFDKKKGGVLFEVFDKDNPSSKFNTAKKTLLGEWTVELENSPSFSSCRTHYLRGEYVSRPGEAILKIFSQGPDAGLIQTYTLKENNRYLVCKGSYENLSNRKVLLQKYQYKLGRLALGGSLENNRFIYPPTAFYFMKGEVKNATAGYMGTQYIYGHMQPTHGMMLPYAMIYNDICKECVTVSGVNSKSKVRVGALGGDSGSLTALFEIFRIIGHEQVEELGTVYLAFFPGDWQKGMLAEKELLMKEAGYKAPETLPGFVKDMVLIAEGIPGVGINTFDDLGNALKDYKDAGFTDINTGGRTWFCPSSMEAEKGVRGFIPIPKNGYVVPDPVSGGEEGLKRFIAKAHAMGMRVFTWGPTSMAGIDISSEEAKTEPDWWVYDKEGKFSKWYKFMAPANPASPGWREFMLKNVEKIIKDYGFDGFWLDSSWQDHQLNYKAKDGWYGGPNGAKNSLLSEIVKTAKSINPDCVVMAEGAGAETMSRVDIAYLQVFGIWPAIKPEEMQKFILVQELNLIPGIRPFGYVQQGLGFYKEVPANRDLAEKYKESWKAKSFLVSTLDRIPYYWGLNWSMRILFLGDKATYPPGTENNPERLEAEKHKSDFARWFDTFKQLNNVRKENLELRDGQTIFDCVEVSSPVIVHYLRHLPKKDSIVLVNAELVPKSFTLKIAKPEILKINPEKNYQVKNLMTGSLVLKHDQTENWKGSELKQGKLTLTLDGYEGAILKVVPR